jgi:hypothetical protein
MYRPNFCAECGARIERVRWHWWTSRRFCPNCERQFRRTRITQPLFVCLLLLGLGFGAGRALRPAPPPLVVANGTQPAPVLLADAVATHAAPAYGPDGTAAERPTDPNEIVSICGARTKKGTPCQRRVRGTGRCWQHLGKPAMLPSEKLIVQGHLPTADSKDDKP